MTTVKFTSVAVCSKLSWTEGPRKRVPVLTQRFRGFLPWSPILRLYPAQVPHQWLLDYMVFMFPSKCEILCFSLLDGLALGELSESWAPWGIFVGELAGFYAWEYDQESLAPGAQVCSHTGHSGVACGFPWTLDQDYSLNSGPIWPELWLKHMEPGRKKISCRCCCAEAGRSHLSCFVLRPTKAPGNKRLGNTVRKN